MKYRIVKTSTGGVAAFQQSGDGSFGTVAVSHIGEVRTPSSALFGVFGTGAPAPSPNQPAPNAEFARHIAELYVANRSAIDNLTPISIVDLHPALTDIQERYRREVDALLPQEGLDAKTLEIINDIGKKGTKWVEIDG